MCLLVLVVVLPDCVGRGDCSNSVWHYWGISTEHRRNCQLYCSTDKIAMITLAK